MAEIAIEPIRSSTAFMGRWQDLSARADQPTFFQSPFWIRAWLDSKPSGVKLFCVEASQSDAPVMMAVVGAGRRRPAMIGLKEARFFETGDPAFDSVYSEYSDFLSVRAADPSLRGEMIAVIARRFRDADSIVFRNLREDMMKAVRSFATAGAWNANVLREQPVYAIDLAASRSGGGDYINSLEGSIRGKIRRAIRGYEERGALSCSVAKKQDRPEAWNRLAELHEARWDGKGAFSNKAFCGFHARLQELAPDACDLIQVRCGDDVIGVLYNFNHGGRVMNYQSGFKAENDNKLTPGFVCHALACQHYLEHGANVYDLLAGDADYKRRLGAQTETLTSIALERPNWRIKARNFMKRRSVING